MEERGNCAEGLEIDIWATENVDKKTQMNGKPKKRLLGGQKRKK